MAMNPEEMMLQEQVDPMPMDNMAMMPPVPDPMAMQPPVPDPMAMQPEGEMMLPTDNPMAEMPPEAREALMQPDPEITTVLMARLANLDRSELQELDKIITPEVAPIVLRLLPEMGQLFNAMEQQGFMEMEEGEPPATAGEELGALGSV